jgi:fumarate reductase subunit D
MMFAIFRPNIVRLFVIAASAIVAVLSIRHVIADLRAPRIAGAVFYGLAVIAFIVQIIISIRQIARSVRAVRARMLAKISENSD